MTVTEPHILINCQRRLHNPLLNTVPSLHLIFAQPIRPLVTVKRRRAPCPFASSHPAPLPPAASPSCNNMAAANLFDLNAELGSEEEDDDYDEETGEVGTKTKRVNGAIDDSSEEEEDDEDEEAAAAVR